MKLNHTGLALLKHDKGTLTATAIGTYAAGSTTKTARGSITITQSVAKTKNKKKKGGTAIA